MAHAEADFPELAGESVLNRRLDHEPLAYILGWREFYGRSFHVTPGVLIPRQETEVLVDSALERIPVQPGGDVRVLDLGTGSGCVGITIALERPYSKVTASDISSGALEVAQHNACDLRASVQFVNSDGFEAFCDSSFDFVVTNPPYIGLEEPLHEEVKNFEPHQALFGGMTGIEFYQRIATDGARVISKGGLILMEVGYQQASQVVEVFQSAGWIHVETRNDWSQVPRVVVCSAVGPQLGTKPR
jgi:release factor glutamine methyltransferase